MTEREEQLWEHVAELAKKTNCKKRAVGAIVFNKKLDLIVGQGYNFHPDGICDCDSTRTAIHAEDMAIQQVAKSHDREDLIVFVNHAPCANCKSLIETRVKEVRYRSQK